MGRRQQERRPRDDVVAEADRDEDVSGQVMPGGPLFWIRMVCPFVGVRVCECVFVCVAWIPYRSVR